MRLAIFSAQSEHRPQRMKPVNPGAFSGAAGKTAVVLRIEPLARLSPRTSHRGAAAPLTHPVGLPSSLKVKGIASGGLTATALSPFAAGELQGVWCGHQRR